MRSFEVLEPDPPFCNKTSWIQLGYGFWVNLTFLSLGLSLEFPAVAMPQLKREGVVAMTKNEEAMIVSMLTLSSPIGCIFSGIILDKCGRKISLILCQIPIAAGWFYIAFAKTAKNIIIGRVITGLGIGMAIAAPRVYIAEISLPNMRGVLGALPNLGISIGILIQAALGAFVPWQYLCHIGGTYAVLILLFNFYLPDTPYYTLMKTDVEKTRKCLMKFRSAKYNIDMEMETLKEFKTENNIRSLSACGTIKAMFRPSSCKPFAISLFYAVIAQFTGFMAVTTWAVEILELCQSSVDAGLGNIILAIARIAVGLLTSLLLFKVGRRPMAVVSAVGVSAAALGLGGYLYTSIGHVYPLVFLVIYTTFAVPGYMTLPPLMMFELLPLQVRGVLSGLVLSATHLTMFGTVYMFPTMRDGIGLNNTFITYGCISLLGALILLIVLPETQNLTLQEIEEYFNRRRPTLVSERRLMSAQLQHSFMSVHALRGESKSHIHFGKKSTQDIRHHHHNHKSKNFVELSDEAKADVKRHLHGGRIEEGGESSKPRNGALDADKDNIEGNKAI